MRRLPLLLLIALGCSGDDAHKPTTPRPAAASTATVTAPAPKPEPLPSGPTALTEAMAQPYWTSPDELAAAQQLGLEAWQP
ncbi:MAG TPA: hypothetical protein VGC42_04280, partial [Kofleriaceae bacterium]